MGAATGVTMVSVCARSAGVERQKNKTRRVECFTKTVLLQTCVPKACESKRSSNVGGPADNYSGELLAADELLRVRPGSPSLASSCGHCIILYRDSLAVIFDLSNYAHLNSRPIRFERCSCVRNTLNRLSPARQCPAISFCGKGGCVPGPAPRLSASCSSGAPAIFAE